MESSSDKHNNPPSRRVGHSLQRAPDIGTRGTRHRSGLAAWGANHKKPKPNAVDPWIQVHRPVPTASETRSSACPICVQYLGARYQSVGNVSPVCSLSTKSGNWFLPCTDQAASFQLT